MNKNNGSHETLIGVALLAGLLLIALVLALIAGIEWYLNPESKLTMVERKNLLEGLASAGQALAVFFTGAVGLIGLFFTWQNISQARESTQQTLELTERGQITERFTRAIDQLGKVDDKSNKLFEIRIGGIYALEQIARESEEDYWPTMEVLTAYVRQHSPRRVPKERHKDMQGEAGEKRSSRTRVRLLDPDIQAIMSVIRRRSRSFKHGESEPLDLRVTYLEKANLWKADLSGVLLWGADLSGANLSGSNLSKAYLMGVEFSAADLQGADLRGANLRGAKLTQAQLEETTGDGNTLRPSGLTPPAHWGVKPDEQIEEN